MKGLSRLVRLLRFSIEEQATKKVSLDISFLELVSLTLGFCTSFGARGFRAAQS